MLVGDLAGSWGHGKRPQRYQRLELGMIISRELSLRENGLDVGAVEEFFGGRGDCKWRSREAESVRLGDLAGSWGHGKGLQIHQRLEQGK